jgi:hypothetical protein
VQPRQTGQGATRAEGDTASTSRAANHATFFSEFARRATLGTEEPVYTFIHLATPHPPTVTENDCGYQGRISLTPDSYRSQGRCALLLVQELLDRLRALDLYNSSVIILTSDHGWRVPRLDSRLQGNRSPAGNLDVVALSATPLLAIKPADRTGPLELSYAPTAITDIPATIFDLVGLSNASNQGRAAFKLDPEARRTRIYTHHSWTNADWSRRYFDKLHIFSIDGRFNDPASWHYQRAISGPSEAQLDAQQAVEDAQRAFQEQTALWQKQYPEQYHAAIAEFLRQNPGDFGRIPTLSFIESGGQDWGAYVQWKGRTFDPSDIPPAIPEPVSDLPTR